MDKSIEELPGWTENTPSHHTANAKTVGELIELLKEIPQGVRVTAIGNDGVELTFVQLIDENGKPIDGVCIE